MRIKINNETSIDLEKLVDSKILIQANSGGGKSWAIRRLLEQSHGKVQHIVIDPEGEFGTLREKYEYIQAGKDCDVPVTNQSAALLAHRLLEFKASAIIDLYELQPQERRHFVKLFLDAIVNSPKELHHPCLIVLDEAHMFAPEKGESEALNSVIDLASRGRKRGFGVCLATQRISKLHKDAAAECNNKLIGRTGLDIDRKRAAEEIGFTSKEDILSLRTLEPGEFYAFGPAISTEVIKIRVGEVETSHPKAGARGISAPVAPTARMKGILAKLSDLPQEAKKQAETMDDLRSEIRTLKAHRCPKVQTNGMSLPEINKYITAAVDPWKKQAHTLDLILKKIIRGMDSVLPKTLPSMPEGNFMIGGRVPVEGVVIQSKPKPVEKVVYKEELKLSGEADGISVPEQRLLDAIAWFESIGQPEPKQSAVSFVAGYKLNGGGFKNPRGALRTKGYIEYRGDQLVLTEAGRQYAKTPEEAVTTDELHKKVLAILDQPEQKLLKPLLEAYPESISNEGLAERSGYQLNSGGYKNPRGRLRALGLIEYGFEGVKAAKILFLE